MIHRLRPLIRTSRETRSLATSKPACQRSCIDFAFARAQSLIRLQTRAVATNSTRPGQLQPSEHRLFRRRLERRGLDKWGFVIYRCSYSDDQAWADCKSIFLGRAHHLLSDKAELANTLDLKVFDDIAAFRDASKEDLRRHFQEWARSAWPREQPRAQQQVNLFPELLPRYRYFVQIDQAAMESVLENLDIRNIDPWDTGFVNLVDAHWKSQADRLAELAAEGNELDEDDEPDLSFEPIEGCREEDVGWMRLPSSRMVPRMYEELDLDDSLCYVNYRRPPETAR